MYKIAVALFAIFAVTAAVPPLAVSHVSRIDANIPVAKVITPVVATAPVLSAAGPVLATAAGPVLATAAGPVVVGGAGPVLATAAGPVVVGGLGWPSVLSSPVLSSGVVAVNGLGLVGNVIGDNGLATTVVAAAPVIAAPSKVIV